MMISMFASVSGLKAHQKKMDVIGNNIANINTVAFKQSRVTFQEVFSQTISGAGAPNASSGRGGTNPLQIGLGLDIGSVDMVTTRGSMQRTDSPTDLSIEGEGYFIIKGSNSDTLQFTRAGNFGVDKLGNLVAPNGMIVQGWLDYGGTSNSDGTYTFKVDKPIESINLFYDEYNKNKKMIPAKATSKVDMTGNLDARLTVSDPDNDDAQFTVPMTIYDSLGNEYKINLNFWKVSVDPGSEAIWAWSVEGLSSNIDPTNLPTLSFDLSSNTPGALKGGSPTKITFTPDASIGSAAFDVEFDFSKMTMFAADNSAAPLSVDGYHSGDLVSFTIGADGMIIGVYSNGQQQPLGLIALATFQNPAGLQRVGNNAYIPTVNSGNFEKAVMAGTGGSGTLIPGTLEMSNVDLAQQFTEMIVTQRGFQANSRIMTTIDEMLQELANMKR